jgi:hypothetical protein
LVKSTQIRWFSRRSGEGGWSSRAVAQRRPRVSKLGLKGLSDYHYNETAVEAARRGTIGLDEKGYSHGISTQKESWTIALSLSEQGQKAAYQSR